MSRAWIAAAVCVGGMVGVHAQPALRVCADPDNLPFSKAEGPEHGLYIDVAERVAQKLGRRIEYVWYASSYQRRALRNTVQANECDAWFALPADAEYRARGLQKSVGIVHVGYAVVAPAGLAFTKLDDLKGRRVAVTFASTPAVLLASIDGVTVVTERTVEAALDVLARGDADVAFVWGPSAGYDIDRRFKGRWQVTSVTGHGLGGPVSAAVRRDQPELLKSIDRELEQMRPDIDAWARKYGFPQGRPVALEKTSALSVPTEVVPSTRHALVWAGRMPTLALVVDAPAAAASKPAARKAPAKAAATTAAPAAAATTAAAAPAAPADPLVAAGREKFNDVCSHCHSPDGASPMRERDLRRMKMRYDDKWPEMAVKTINEGRPQLGMPTWKGQITDPEIEKIVAFLKTIQK